MPKKEISIEKLEKLILELHAKADAYPDGCATGYTDYQHAHAWASDCAACGERSMARDVLNMLEQCYVTPPHKKSKGK